MMFFYFFQFSGLATLVSRGALMSLLPFQHSYCLARGFLFLLAGVGFLLVLTACGGGSSGGGTDSSPSTEPSVRGLDCSADAGEDCDGDGHRDNVDIDDDGDGLIEIRTAAQLDEVRYALNGDGRRSSEDEALDTTGCGGNQGVTSCSGYELVADISLATYVNADGGKGWQPLGHDSDSSTAECEGSAFEGTFEGNDWTISDLNISRSGEHCVGLFGQIEGGEVRNLEVEATHITGNSRVGILAGDATRATILNTNVFSFTVRGEGDHVGGLIGYLFRSPVTSTSAEVTSQIVGKGRVGGLIGHNVVSNVRHSSALSNDIRGEHRVGGLHGSGWDTGISGSVAFFNELHGGEFIGGLIGRSTRGKAIVASMAHFSLINGSSSGVGGLVGGGDNMQVVSSMASGVGMVGNQVGGLIGSVEKVSGGSENIFVLTSSYAVISDINGSSPATNGLIGRNRSMVAINASYWAVFPSDNLPSDAFAKSISELQSPTDFSGSIYDSWDDGADITRWCDSNNNGRIEEGERNNNNLIWDLGETDEYPAIRCIPITPAEWRDRW